MTNKYGVSGNLTGYGPTAHILILPLATDARCLESGENETISIVLKPCGSRIGLPPEDAVLNKNTCPSGPVPAAIQASSGLIATQETRCP